MSQKTAQLKSEGESAFADGRWAEALDLLSKYQEQKPGEIGVLTKIGRASYYLHQPDKAKQYLEYVTTTGRSIEPDTWFAFARTLHGLQEWERAIEAYKQFLRLAPDGHIFRANARDNIRRCVSGQHTQPNDNVALVENMGNQVNSSNDEFAPLPSVAFADRMYYSASRSSSTGGKRNDDGYADEKTGHWCSDMYSTKRSTKGWEAPTVFSTLQNTARFEVALDFTNNGQVLCFSRGFTLYSGEILTDTANLKDEYRSQASALNSPMRPELGDVHPFFFGDTVLLFCSRREGGQGGLDLWVSVYSNSQWSQPANLGPQVNSAYDEVTPFVASDGKTLYFSSNRTESIGGLDVWRTTYDPTKRLWEVPLNQGLGINSPGDDESFRLSTDGRTATFASDRITDNLGERDLYMAYFKEEVPEQVMGSKASFVLFDPATTKSSTNNLIQDVALQPLFYTTDRDLLSPNNIKIMGQALALTNQYPNIHLLITVHTDETGPAKFDLFNGIKRAEQVGKYYTERGLEASRILLRSAGPSFPLARNIQNGAPSTVGQGLNRRVEIALLVPPGSELPFKTSIERPLISDEVSASGTARLDEQNTGLLYRVEFATTRQVLTTDALGMFSDLLIESEPGSGNYRYVTGAIRQYAQTAALKKDLLAQGFSELQVVPYINGLRIARAEAIGLIKKYPDLAAFIKG